MAQSSDGNFVKFYATLSWLLLRFYALTFLGLSYIAMQWLSAEDPQISVLALGQEPVRAAIVLTFVGIVLLLPPLTPRFVALPRSIIAGVLGAGLIAGLSYYLSLTVPVVLTAEMVPYTDLVAPYAQPVIACLAGTLMVGALLVSGAQEIARARNAARATVASHVVQAELRSLRHMRMQ